MKNIVARQVCVGQKLYLSPMRGSQRIIKIEHFDFGYKVRIETLYDTVVYGSESSVQIDEE